MSWQRVQPGDTITIPAEAYNAMLSAAEAHRSSLRGVSRTSESSRDAHDVVLVRNDTGADVGRFGILGLGDPVILPSVDADEFAARIAFAGESPSVDDHGGRFAVCLEPIADGGIGSVLVSGVTACRVDVQDTADGCAEIDDTDGSRLRSCPQGPARILWAADVTGEQWAVVRVGDPDLGGVRLAIVQADVGCEDVDGCDATAGTGEQALLNGTLTTVPCNGCKIKLARLSWSGSAFTVAAEAGAQALLAAVPGGPSNLCLCVPSLQAGDVVFVTRVDGYWAVIGTFDTGTEDCEA